MIYSGPKDQVVAPGDVAYFNCHARGNTIQWYINGTVVPVTMTGRVLYVAKGFYFIDGVLPNNERNNTITVTAHQSINSTIIECAVTMHGPGRVSQNGTLIIAGRTNHTHTHTQSQLI